jgi:CheY-like chemotaxis protein
MGAYGQGVFMKHILLIDDSTLFRDYLQARLSIEGECEVSVAVNGLDGISKIRTTLPDLIIIDYHLSRKTCKEVLEEKKRNPNTAKVPVVLTATKIDRRRIMELVPYDVKKVLAKPIRIDALLETVGGLLGLKYKVDTTPGVLEAHVNDNIVFVEIAQGLNREKIEMLRFKLSELRDLYSVAEPRVLLMVSDVDFSFSDAPNLELLVTNVIKYSGAKPRHIRFLTTSTFITDFLAGHKDFEGIEVTTSLSAALDGLLSDSGANTYHGAQAAHLFEKIVAPAESHHDQESFELRFERETARDFAVENAAEAGAGLRIACVDDDPIIQELAKTTFKAINAEVVGFDDGKAFLDAINAGQTFDLILLDLLMPKVDGFGVLNAMRAVRLEIPVIVLSAVSQREAIVKAFQSGVKSYLVKPLNPSAIMKKAAEILRANF